MVRHEVPVEVIFGFSGEVLLKGKRKTRPHVVSDKVLVGIPTAAADEAPFVVETPGSWKSDEVRIVDGRFWRPVCHYGDPMTLDALASLASEGSRRRSDDGSWYPFPTGCEGLPQIHSWLHGREEDDRNIFDSTRFRAGTTAVRGFDVERRDEAADRCRRVASDGLLAIEGFLYRACAVPALDLRFDWGCTSVELVLDAEPRPGRVRVGLSDFEAVLAMPGVAGAPEIAHFQKRHRLFPVPETVFDLRAGNAGNLARTMGALLDSRHSAKGRSDRGWQGREHSVLSASRIEERLALLSVAAEAVRCASGAVHPDGLWRLASEASASHPEIAAAVARFEDVFESLAPVPEASSLINP